MQTAQSKIVKRKSSKVDQASEILRKKRKNSSSSEDEVLRDPTTEELNESTKPENTYSVQSIRSKQRAKHENNIQQKSTKTKLQHKQTLENYLTIWREDHSNWKYKKILQIEIVSKMFDEHVINKNFWPIVLEYLSGSAGKAKERIIEKAQKQIAALDEEVEKGKKELLKSVTYSRARQLLQNLN